MQLSKVFGRGGTFLYFWSAINWHIFYFWWKYACLLYLLYILCNFSLPENSFPHAHLLIITLSRLEMLWRSLWPVISSTSPAHFSSLPSYPSSFNFASLLFPVAHFNFPKNCTYLVYSAAQPQLHFLIPPFEVNWLYFYSIIRAGWSAVTGAQAVTEN